MATLDQVLLNFDRRLAEIEKRMGLSSPAQPESARAEPAPAASTGSFFGVVGIAFVLLAALFFLKLTLDSGWLTPHRQVALAALFGLGCLLLPHFVKRLGDDYGALLSGTGAAVLHITWLGAYELHQLLDAQGALLMATLVGVLSILLNARMGNAVFVVVAVAGTYLSAPLIGYHTGDLTALSSFFLIWNISFSALAFLLRRRDVLLVAAYFAVLTVGLFSLTQQPLSPDLARSFLGLQGLQFAIFAGATLLFSVLHAMPLKEDESWATCLLLLLFYADVYSMLAVLAPELAPWIGVALSLGVLAIYRVAAETMQIRLESTGAITSFAALVLLHSLYFRLTPDEFKPGFSLFLALTLALATRGRPSEFWHYPLRIAVIAIGYGAMLSFSPIFSTGLTLTYHFAFGLVSLALASALVGLGAPVRRSEVPAGALLLGFGHIEMLFGLYKVSHLVEMSGSLFVSVTWGLYALAILAWSYAQRDRVVGQSAVLILAAVALKAAFYDVLLTGSLARVFSLLAAGLILYACGWVFRQMQGWQRAA